MGCRGGHIKGGAVRERTRGRVQEPRTGTRVRAMFVEPPTGIGSVLRAAGGVAFKRACCPVFEGLWSGSSCARAPNARPASPLRAPPALFSGLYCRADRLPSHGPPAPTLMTFSKSDQFFFFLSMLATFSKECICTSAG